MRNAIYCLHILRFINFPVSIFDRLTEGCNNTLKYGSMIVSSVWMRLFAALSYSIIASVSIIKVLKDWLTEHYLRIIYLSV